MIEAHDELREGSSRRVGRGTGQTVWVVIPACKGSVASDGTSGLRSPGNTYEHPGR